jgi:hypothetical protein
MKHIKLFESFDSQKEIDIKTGEFYKTYLNLYWLCCYFDNVDNFQNTKPAIFKEHKKFPMDKDLRIDGDNLYFNGFPIPLAKSEDDFRSLEVSVFNSLENDDEWDVEARLGENLSPSVYGKRFNSIYSKVHNLDLAINKLYKDIDASFYKDVIILSGDELLKQTTLESKEYFIKLLQFTNEFDTNLFNIINRAFNNDKPVLLEKIWYLWNR